MEIGVFGPCTERQSGPEQVTLGIAAGYRALGHDVEIVSYGNSGCDDKTDVPVETVGGAVDSLSSLREANRRAAEATTEYDLVHATNGSTFPVDICTLQWAGTGLDLLRDDEYDGSIDLRRISSEIARVSEKVARADDHGVVTAQSPVTARQLDEYWAYQPDEVVPLGVKAEQLREPTRAGEPLTVLLPGRVTPKKGQHRVLNRLDGEPFEVESVGHVHDPSEIEEDGERLTGYLPRTPYNDRLTAADICVVPSYHENFSLSALESMARGCIVVATEDCGIAQIGDVADTPGMIVVSDGREAVEVLREVADESVERRFHRQRASYEVACRHTWEQIARQYLRLSQRHEEPAAHGGHANGYGRPDDSAWPRRGDTRRQLAWRRQRRGNAAKAVEEFRELLNDRLSDWSFETRPSGSYVNHVMTAGSDLDILVTLIRPAWGDTSHYLLDDSDRRAPGDVRRAWSRFRSEVLSVLREWFGTRVIEDGAKAIRVESSRLGIPVDTVVGTQFAYGGDAVTHEARLDTGVTLWTDDGTELVHFPFLHRRDGWRKQFTTRGRYLQTVRSLKAVRDRLEDHCRIPVECTPGYYLEHLCRAVPEAVYDVGGDDAVAPVVEWLRACDLTEMTIIDGSKPMFGSHEAQWSLVDARLFLDEAANYLADDPDRTVPRSSAGGRSNDTETTRFT